MINDISDDGNESVYEINKEIAVKRERKQGKKERLKISKNGIEN